MSKLSLVVVDDHSLFRAGLINLLEEMQDFVVVGEAGDGNQALEVIAENHPDVVLLDVNMPGMGGVETVSALRNNPATRGVHILMLTISKSEQDLFGAIDAGADGYLLKNAEPDELWKAIHQVQQGNAVLAPQVTRQVLQAVNAGPGRRQDFGLSDREMDVLETLARGLTTNQIADQLVISENTVKTHVRHILEKLQASNRAEAVSKALQMGLIGKKN
jgi:DNA-binding NarL/FixJ family response regulator